MMGEERGLFTVGVAGCGQRQVYQVICPMGGDGCTALEGRTPQVPWGYVGFPLCRRMFQINLIHMRRDANDKAGVKNCIDHHESIHGNHDACGGVFRPAFDFGFRHKQGQ